MAKKKVVPMNANFEELCKLKRDNVDVGDFCIMTDSSVVWLSEHKAGHQRKQHIEIPRAVFNKLLRWYVSNVIPREDRRQRRAIKTTPKFLALKRAFIVDELPK